MLKLIAGHIIGDFFLQINRRERCDVFSVAYESAKLF